MFSVACSSVTNLLDWISLSLGKDRCAGHDTRRLSFCRLIKETQALHRAPKSPLAPPAI